MRASEVVALIQERIAEFGDMEMGVCEPLTNDWITRPVSDVTFGTIDSNNQCMVIE